MPLIGVEGTAITTIVVSNIKCIGNARVYLGTPVVYNGSQGCPFEEDSNDLLIRVLHQWECFRECFNPLNCVK